MKVKDAMHRGVTCLESNATISEIAKCMRDADIGAIPIRERGQLVGMVTDRDIACRAFVNGDEDGRQRCHNEKSRVLFP